MQLANVRSRDKSGRADEIGRDEEMAFPPAAVQHVSSRKRTGTPIVKSQKNRNFVANRSAPEQLLNRRLGIVMRAGDRLEMTLEIGGVQLIDVRVRAVKTAAGRAAGLRDIVIQQRDCLHRLLASALRFHAR